MIGVGGENADTHGVIGMGTLMAKAARRDTIVGRAGNESLPPSSNRV
jgi:hypothetical protein